MDPVTMVIIVYLAIMLFISIFGNSSTILIILLNRDMQTTNNMFILNLAMSDLLFSVVATPLRFVYMFGGVVTLKFCKATLFFGMFFFHASVAGLLTLSIDRYICITRPLHYQNCMLKRRAKSVVAIGWTLSLLISIVPLLNIDIFQPEQNYNNSCRYGTIMSKNYIIFLIVSTEFVTTFIIIVLYSHIFLVANKHAQRIQTERRIHGSISENKNEIDSIAAEPSSIGWYAEDETEVPNTQASAEGKDTTPSYRRPSVCSAIFYCCNLKSKRIVGPKSPKPIGVSNNGFAKSDVPGVDAGNVAKEDNIAVIHTEESCYHEVPKLEGEIGQTTRVQSLEPIADHQTLSTDFLTTRRESWRVSNYSVGNVTLSEENSVTRPQKSIKVTKTSTTRSNGSNTRASLQTINGKKWRKSKKLHSFKREYKAAKLIGAVVGLFMICVLPIAFLDILELTETGIRAPSWLVSVAICLVSTNPAVNSILYAIGKNDFRLSYYKLWTCGRYSRGG